MSFEVELGNGETLECRKVTEPKDGDAEAILHLLGHKGSPWLHHIERWAAGEIKRLETRFYTGSIAGIGVGNIMTVEHKGIGLMGHVCTDPKHRRKGICNALMEYHMNDFRKREGTILCLNTGYRSPAYMIYERHGYRPIPGRPGSMWWSPAYWDVESPFDELHLYDDLSRADIIDPQWHHWPTMNLFTHLPTEQVVRSVNYGVFEVHHSEAAFLQMMLDAHEGGDVQVKVLETSEGHVAGFASLAPDSRWGKAGENYVFDIFVHPGTYGYIPDVVKSFRWPDGHVLVYVAETDSQVIEQLAECGFHPHSHIERFFRGGTGLVIMDWD